MAASVGFGFGPFIASLRARRKNFRLVERMAGMMVRFMNTVQAAHISFLDQGAFDRWTEPTIRGKKRLAGIDLNKARNRQVVDAVVALSTHPNGFTL